MQKLDIGYFSENDVFINFKLNILTRNHFFI